MFFKKNVKYNYGNTLLEGGSKMALDKIVIGERVRKIREDTFEESRIEFGKRCGLTDRCIGQIERGEFLFSLPTLDKISSATGIDTDYILYGNGKKEKSTIRQALHNIIDKLNKDEVTAYYKCISIMRKVKEKDR